MTEPANSVPSPPGDRQRVKRLGPPQDVPVFNCVVNVASPGADGLYIARVANLANLVARGKSERDALAQVVGQFKDVVARYHADGQPIPWIDPPQPPGQGEVQRFIAMHL